MELSNQQTNEEQTADVLGILLSVVSHRLWIIVSIVTSIFLGIIYNYYNPDVFKTAATLLITKDQSDPSSFLLNNENEFLYNKYIEGEDHASVFNSTLILNKVVENLGLNYRYFKKNKWKTNELLTKESLPFEFYFKNNKTENNCIVSFKKEQITIAINDKIFSFSSNESEFENSLFSYKTKFLNDVGQDTYIINKFDMTQTVNAIKSNYSVSTTKKSNTYGISYFGPNKALNSTILNGIVDGIIENDISEKKNVYQVSINFIDSRIYTLQGKIDSLNTVISNYKLLNGLYMPQTQTNSELINLNEIKQKIFNNSLQTELSFKLINEVEKQNSFEYLPTDIGIENENINQMVFQFNKIILEKNTLLVEATEKNPLVIQSQNQLIDLRADKLKMKLNRYKSYKQKSNTLVGLIPLRESELNNLEKELLLASNLHSYLSQKKEEALINLSSLQSNIKLINNVNYILESKTNKPRTLSLFLLAGFMLPVGFSLLIYFFRMIYIDIEYLEQKLTDINFLGIVKFSKKNVSMENKSIQNELLKRIYHNINMLIPKSGKGTSIMITSCIKNEGKTFTAYNLSTFLASKGKKVVLIGTDLGNPDLSKLFDQKNKTPKGLTNIINDTKNDFKELFEDYKTTNKQLDTLFVGTKINTKISVFDTQKFDDLISYLKEKYDYIIFDSAPILFMVDSLELLEKSDYVVHVFRKNLVNYVLDYKEITIKKTWGM